MELESLNGEHRTSSGEDSRADSADEFPEKERASWGSRFEFLLAIVGYTVGVGSIWRFPILCAKNGGGAFLIPFFFFMATCGGPLYYIEVCLGQFSGKSAGAAFEFCPLLKGLGILMLLISFSFLWYYMIIMGYIQYYFVCAFFPNIPWSSCDNWWNTKDCKVTPSLSGGATTPGPTVLYNVTGNVTGVSTASVIAATTANVTDRMSFILSSPAQEFWLYNVLRKSSGLEDMGVVHWHLLVSLFVAWMLIVALDLIYYRYNVLRKSSGLEDMGVVHWHLVVSLFVAWVLIVAALIKGVKSLGKVVYFTATAPYILLTVLLIRGVTLDGSSDGLLWYIVPDFEKLLHSQVWLDAAVQVFYSLGPTWGGVISMSSHNRFHQKSILETTICVISDAFTAFYGGLVVFSCVGFMAKKIGVSVDELAKASGPGLAFVMFPEAIMRMPLPHLWGVLFFFTLIVTAFDTMFGSYETVVGTLVDKYPDTLGKRNTLVLIGTAFFLFLMGIPFCMSGGIYLFQLADWYSSSIALLFGSSLECITICWIYGADRLAKDIELMTGRKTCRLLRVLWCFVMTGFLCFTFLISMFSYSQPNYGGGYVYQPYAIRIGVALAMIPIIPVPVYVVMALLSTEGSLLQRVSTSLKPSPRWQPADQKARIIYREKPYTQPPGFWARVKTTLMGDSDTPWL